MLGNSLKTAPNAEIGMKAFFEMAFVPVIELCT